MSSIPLRVVLDTTNIVSTIRSNDGAAASVVRSALRRRFVLFMDYKIACEYRDVGLRPLHTQNSSLSESQIAALIDSLELVAEPVDIVWRHRPLSTDPNDDLVLDLAINGNADVIVTDNLRHFQRPSQAFGIAVRSPRDFLITMSKRGIDGDAQ